LRHPAQDRGHADLEAVFPWPLAHADQIRSQQQRQRGWKLYSFHAPEVECIGKGKASAPEGFHRHHQCAGPQFVLHARALPGNPYDGHTLGSVIEATQRLTGREIERAYVDKGYRGHYAPNPRRVFISGQKRGVFGRIKRELRRRSAIETVIGQGRGPSRPLLSQRSRRRRRQRHPQRRRLQPPPRSRLAEDDFARRSPRALLQIFAIQPALKPAS